MTTLPCFIRMLIISFFEIFCLSFPMRSHVSPDLFNSSWSILMINWAILSFTMASWSSNKSELRFAHSLTRLTPHSVSSFGVLWILIAVFSSISSSCNSCSSYVKHKQFCSLFPCKFLGNLGALLSLHKLAATIMAKHFGSEPKPVSFI